jgi:hypothetical protein
MIYKCTPSFYHQIPAQEDLYALFLMKAELIRRDTGLVIDRVTPIVYQERRRRGIKKAKKVGIEVQEARSFDAFWNEILVPNLLEKFGVKPVHSLNEITYLKHQTPEPFGSLMHC